MVWPFQKRRASKETDYYAKTPKFTFALGRRHLNESHYVMPNDLEEANRLDLQHFLVRAMAKGNYWAPLRNPTSILDVAGGTGRWAMEVAEQFPNANIVNLEIAPTPHTGPIYNLKSVPSNYVEIQGDMLKGLPFSNNSFDFGHMRAVMGATPKDSWIPLIKDLVRVTKRHGWIELCEVKLPHQVGTGTIPIATNHLTNLITEISLRRGIDLLQGLQIASMVHQVGLKNIYARRLPLILGEKGGRVGLMGATDILAAYKGIGSMVVKMEILTEEALEGLLAQMKQEFSKGNVAIEAIQVIGQKP
jgi:ubiquinone/menaquinone biosynthesis C-methylase UbiE